MIHCIFRPLNIDSYLWLLKGWLTKLQHFKNNITYGLSMVVDTILIVSKHDICTNFPIQLVRPTSYLLSLLHPRTQSFQEYTFWALLWPRRWHLRELWSPGRSLALHLTSHLAQFLRTVNHCDWLSDRVWLGRSTPQTATNSPVPPTSSHQHSTSSKIFNWSYITLLTCEVMRTVSTCPSFRHLPPPSPSTGSSDLREELSRNDSH